MTTPKAELEPHVEFEIEARGTIRKAVKEDLPLLEWFGMFTPHRDIIRSVFAAQVRHESMMLVADVNGFPVAQLWIDLRKRRAERVGILWALRVIPCYERMGIGTRLMDAAEHVLRDKDYSMAELGVERTSTIGRFYERLGYEPCGTLLDEYHYKTPEGAMIRVPIDQLLYCKHLGASRRTAAK